jgi:hypothetical protein
MDGDPLHLFCCQRRFLRVLMHFVAMFELRVVNNTLTLYRTGLHCCGCARIYVWLGVDPTYVSAFMAIQCE